MIPIHRLQYLANPFMRIILVIPHILMIHHRLHPRLLYALSIWRLLPSFRQFIVASAVRIRVERECDERVNRLGEDFEREGVVACLLEDECLGC